MVNFVPALFDRSKPVTINSAGTIVPNSGNPYNGLVLAGNGIPSDQQGRVPGSTTALFQSFPTDAPRGFYDNQNVFMPRFGLAYAVNPKTVVRTGYGTYYTRAEGNIIFSQLNIPPITQITQLYNANLGNPAGGSTLAAPLANINALNPKLTNGYAQQFSFSIQRELAKGIVAEIAYVGNLGRHLLRAPDVNQIPFVAFAANAQSPSAQQVPQAALRPYPGFSSILQYNSDSTMNYHALQSYVSKRTGNIFMTASYTFSKSLGDTNAEGDNPENYLDRHFNYGPTSFDRRHVFIATYVWSLPRLQSWNPVLRGAMGSWMLNGIIRLQSGQYYSILGSTAEGTRRADYLGTTVYPANQGPNGWFNAAAFVVAPVSRLGNSGTGFVEGPPLQVFNLSLAKNFRYTERYNLKLQADFFNAINRANFSGLGTTVTSAGFGTLSSAYPPRQIQLSLKMTF
jgi:TonB dependent receptor